MVKFGFMENERIVRGRKGGEGNGVEYTPEQLSAKIHTQSKQLTPSTRIKRVCESW
jgi:hypothetical protein